MKLGRNDPCPCGSGKKYKHCCLINDSAVPASVFARQRLKSVCAGMPLKLLQFTMDRYGYGAIQEAWREFFCFPTDMVADDYEDGTVHDALFRPWFLHLWKPDPHETSVQDPRLIDCSPTNLYLEEHGSQLDPLLRRYLEACTQAPLSFFQILRVEPGSGLRVRNLLRVDEFDVAEQSASRTLQVDDVLYAQIVKVDDIAVIEACAPCSLRPLDALGVIAMRERILAKHKRTADAIAQEWDLEFREYYVQRLQAVMEPKIPVLQNFDGDPLVPIKLVFDIDTVSAALESLSHLADADAGTGPKHDLDIERDEAGNVTRANFDWLRAGKGRKKTTGPIVLGSIEITPNRLTCEVNSEKRATAFRRLIEKTPQSTARFRASQIQSIEKQLRDRHTRPPNAPLHERERQIAESPEVQAKIAEMMAAHYQRWPEEKLPALNNRTPLQAMRTKAGRERLEILVRNLERHGARMVPALDGAVSRQLRKRLGLEQNN